MANYLLSHTGAQIEEAVSLALAGVQDASILPVKLSTGHPTWDTEGTLSATAFSGPLTGNVTGNVSGNVTGNVTGELTGNASTATELTTASGSAPSYAARAWVNFNGTGTVAIRASGNVTSITDNSTGDYSVNFTTSMPNTNYCQINSCRRNDTNSGLAASIKQSRAPTTSQCHVVTGIIGSTFTPEDALAVTLSIFI